MVWELATLLRSECSSPCIQMRRMGPPGSGNLIWDGSISARGQLMSLSALSIARVVSFAPSQSPHDWGRAKLTTSVPNWAGGDRVADCLRGKTIRMMIAFHYRGVADSCSHKHTPNAGLMSGQRRRRWADVEPASVCNVHP